MRKLILVGFLISLSTFSLNAQITLTQANTLHNASYMRVININNEGIAIPVEGTNVDYDYSNLPLPIKVDTTIFSPATRENFDTYTRFSLGGSNLGDIRVESEYYTEVTTDGIAETGSFLLSQSSDITAITGSPGDELEFPGSTNIFETPAPIIAFPATYESNWSSTIEFRTDFLLTVASFGLTNTPGFSKQYVSINSDVVGWGKLTLAIAGNNVMKDVLLVKRTELLIDSVFLGGAPAPEPLLDAFQIEQGDTTILNSYEFFAEGHEEPVFWINMSDDFSSVRSSRYDVSFATIVGIEDLAAKGNSSLSLYPNPSTTGSTVFIKGGIAGNNVIVRVYSEEGVLVHEGTVQNTKGKDLAWGIPESMQAGLYHISIVSPQDSEEIYVGKTWIK